MSYEYYGQGVVVDEVSLLAFLHKPEEVKLLDIVSVFGDQVGSINIERIKASAKFTLSVSANYQKAGVTRIRWSFGAFGEGGLEELGSATSYPAAIQDGPGSKTFRDFAWITSSGSVRPRLENIYFRVEAFGFVAGVMDPLPTLKLHHARGKGDTWIQIIIC